MSEVHDLSIAFRVLFVIIGSEKHKRRIAMYQNPHYQPYTSMYQSPYGQQNPYFNNPYANVQNNQQPYQQQQPQMQNPQPTMQMQSNIEYVNGIEGAKAFILPPNTQKLLLDSDNAFFYIKTTDTQGKPSVRRFRYIDIDAEQQAQPQRQEQPQDNYVTLQQFTDLLQNFDDLKKEFEKLKSAKPKKAEESEVKK